MGLGQWFTRSMGSSSPEAIERAINVGDWGIWGSPSSFTYQGRTYQVPPYSMTMPQTTTEAVAESFAGYVQAAYRSNGVVAACMLAREALFSEARFQFRRFDQGRPSQMFGSPALLPLERPWPKGTTSDLLGRMEQDSTLAGNFYGRRVGQRIYRMRPDWTALVLGSDQDPAEPGRALDATIIGYVYYPGGYNTNADPIGMLAEEVVHYAPRKDPEQRYLGMSLLTSAIRDIEADQAATIHKSRFFEGGGVPNKAVEIPIPDPVKFQQAAEEIRNRAGVTDQWLVMQPGATFHDLGSNLQESDFQAVQGAGESRIASALGVPPVIVGLSEGLDSATYSNYGQAMRRFADLTMRPLWRDAASSLQEVIETPAGAQLWYDDRDIPALKDDIVSRADVWTKNAAAARQLVDAGYEPESVRDAIGSDDWMTIEHTGLPTVQLAANGQPALPAAPNGDQAAVEPPEQVARSLVERVETALEKGQQVTDRETIYRASSPAALIYRADDNGEHTVEGLVVPYNEWTEVDSLFEGHFMERFLPGALKKSFLERGRQMKGYFEHGRSAIFDKTPIMDIAETWETERGAFFRATLLRGLPEWMVDGLQRGLYGASIGARNIRTDYVARPLPTPHNPDGLEERSRREVMAHDISLTPQPVYASAGVMMRSITDDLAVEQLAKDPDKFVELVRQVVSFSATEEAEPTHSEPDTPEAVPEPPADPEAKPGEVEPVEKPTEPAQPDPDDVEASRVTQPPDYLREDEEEDWQL